MMNSSSPPLADADVDDNFKTSGTPSCCTKNFPQVRKKLKNFLKHYEEPSWKFDRPLSLKVESKKKNNSKPFF